MTEQQTVKRSLLPFPMIPPLPSSKGLEKENKETPLRFKDSRSKRATPNTGSRRRPLQRNGNDVFRSPTINASQYSGGRILRTGETMQSLFCLSDRTPSEHCDLCQKIVDGRLSDDPSAWCRVLKVACKQVACDQSHGGSFSNTDLMRLHRRAKARFSLLDAKSSCTEVLEIWLSYAETQGHYGSPDEARAVYRLIQNRGYGAKLASFYASMAMFESKFNVTKAVEIVNSGIEKGAEPIELLRATLMELVRTDENLVNNHQFESLTQSSLSNSMLQRRIKQVSIIPPLPDEKRKDTSPKDVHQKRQKIEDGNTRNEGNCQLKDRRTSTGTVCLSLDCRVPSEVACQTPRNDMTQIGSFIAGVEISEPQSPAIFTNQTSLKSKVGERAVLKSRSRLQPKVQRLRPAGLTGGAKRLTPDDVNVLDDWDENVIESLTVKSCSKHVPQDSFASKPAKKISRMDLSYMMNWDPNRRDVATSEQSVSLVTSTVVAQSRDSIKELQPEATESGSKSSGATNSSNAASIVTSQSGSCTQTREICDAEKKPDLMNTEIRFDSTKSSDFLSSEHAKFLSCCNVDFLPLVNENNVIRVNDVPYIKLGVLGKGGSSKVYRVLSKNCSVLAIKKVNIGNLDQKAIDGYANEIALLKKLLGNPFIIQMHDSEIDLSRKAIYLAMEVGEVDLNHVLQQQSLQAAKEGNACQPTLNMNFIRLTWQQMLSAVHSIHEERIIHSDLKPANFLFVRGVLKLIDFGIAKAIQTDDTTNIYRDSQIGTLNYMSPEAILDTGSASGGARMRIGRASDIWSLGCILYQMVFGRTPFASLQMIQKLQAIVNPSHKIEYPGKVDDAAIDAIKQCLRRQPDDRPPIVGKGGLLNEHHFLNHHHAPTSL